MKSFCLWLWRLWLWSPNLPNRTRNSVVIYYYLDKWWTESYYMEILHTVPVTEHHRNSGDNLPFLYMPRSPVLFYSGPRSNFFFPGNCCLLSHVGIGRESHKGCRCLDRLHYPNKQKSSWVIYYCQLNPKCGRNSGSHSEFAGSIAPVRVATWNHCRVLS